MNTFELLEKVDEILSVGPNRFPEIRSYLENPTIRRYFFDELPAHSGAWLSRLAVEGYFSDIPPTRNTPQGTHIPMWQPSATLAHFAKRDPEHVMRAIGEIPETDNGFVIRDIAAAAIDLPLTEVKIVSDDLASRISRLDHLPDGQPIGQLIARLAGEGEFREAQKLFSKLFYIGEPEDTKALLPQPRLRLTSYEYTKALQASFMAYAIAGGHDAFEDLAGLLERYLLVTTRSSGGERYDGSNIWRPSIEKGTGFGETDLRDMLIDVVRDVAFELEQDGSVDLVHLIETLWGKEFSVFRRLALFLLAHFETRLPTVAERFILSHEVFLDKRFRPEYIAAVRRYLEHDRKVRHQVIAWIEKGPDLTTFVDGLLRSGLHAKSAEFSTRLRTAQEEWKRDMLFLLNESLDRAYQDELDRLIMVYGSPDQPDVPFRMTEGFVQQKSPKTSEELRTAAVSEIVDFARRWVPPKPQDLLEEVSRESFANALSEVVTEQPEKFASGADLFVVNKVAPVYTAALLAGLEDASKADRTFSWKPVLDLCRWVAGQDDKTSDSDVSWTWATRRVIYLLIAGLHQDQNEIPYESREDVVELVCQLLRDRNPTAEDYAKSTLRPLDLSLNTNRGSAVTAAVLASLWILRHDEGNSNKEPLSSKEPRLTTSLGERLDLAIENSPGVFAAFGRWLPWLILLDEEWASTMLRRLFSGESERARVLFESYLLANAPYDQTFRVLEGEYLRTTKRLANECGKVPDSDAVCNKLAEHLILLLAREQLTIESDLIQTFFEVMPHETKAHAIGYLGRITVQSSANPSTDFLDRLVKIADWLFDSATKDDGLVSYSDLKEFGWWFSSPAFSPEWRILRAKELVTQIGFMDPPHQYLDGVENVAEEDLGAVLSLLRVAAESIDRAERFFSYPFERSVVRILERVGAVGDQEAAKLALELVVQLGDKGFLRLRPQYRALKERLAT